MEVFFFFLSSSIPFRIDAFEWKCKKKWNYETGEIYYTTIYRKLSNNSSDCDIGRNTNRTIYVWMIMNYFRCRANKVMILHLFVPFQLSCRPSSLPSRFIPRKLRPFVTSILFIFASRIDPSSTRERVDKKKKGKKKKHACYKAINEELNTNVDNTLSLYPILYYIKGVPKLTQDLKKKRKNMHAIRPLARN